MTATVTWHPRTADCCDRINARAAAENIAAERAEATYTDPRVADEVARYENYRTAKTVLRSPDWYGADVVHAALEFVHEYENAVPKTSMEVAMQHKDRWPEILIYAAIGAVVILKVAGWV